MTPKQKTRHLLFLITALASLFLLASGLSTLTFRPGIRFSLGRELARLFENRILGWPVWTLIIAFILIYALSRRRSPPKKEGSAPSAGLLLRLVALAIMLLWLYAFSLLPQPGVPDGQAQVQELESGALPLFQEEADTEAAIEEEAAFSPDPPSWVPLAANLLLAGLAAGIALLLLYYLRRRGDYAPTPLDRLGEEAQEAVEALKSGEDAADVILRIYYQMGRILEEERGIRRGLAMTPAEFENNLVQLGFPAEPVHTLTWLFEQVRYGARRLGENEQRQAAGSLGAIAAFCQREGNPA